MLKAMFFSIEEVQLAAKAAPVYNILVFDVWLAGGCHLAVQRALLDNNKG